MQKYWDDENENGRLAQVRQPQPQGPQPTDQIELEIPFTDIDDETANGLELFPIIRFQ